MFHYIVSGLGTTSSTTSSPILSLSTSSSPTIEGNQLFSEWCYTSCAYHINYGNKELCLLSQLCETM